MPEADEQTNVYQPESGSSGGKWILLALAIIYVGASLFFGYDTHSKLTKLADDQSASQKQIADLTTRMQAAESDAEALGEKIGVTKKEMAQRADELQRQQQAAAARSAEQTAQLKKDVGAVSSEVGNVRLMSVGSRPMWPQLRPRLTRPSPNYRVPSAISASRAASSPTRAPTWKRSSIEAIASITSSPSPRAPSRKPFQPSGCSSKRPIPSAENTIST